MHTFVRIFHTHTIGVRHGAERAQAGPGRGLQHQGPRRVKQTTKPPNLKQTGAQNKSKPKTFGKNNNNNFCGKPAALRTPSTSTLHSPFFCSFFLHTNHKSNRTVSFRLSRSSFRLFGLLFASRLCLSLSFSCMRTLTHARNTHIVSCPSSTNSALCRWDSCAAAAVLCVCASVCCDKGKQLQPNKQNNKQTNANRTATTATTTTRPLFVVLL